LKYLETSLITWIVYLGVEQPTSRITSASPAPATIKETPVGEYKIDRNMLNNDIDVKEM